LVRVVVRGVNRLLGGEPGAALATAPRDRVLTLLKDTTGVLSESQAGMLDRAVAFQQATVAEEMVPWPRVRTIPSDWTREQAARLLSREWHTYWPVVERRGPGGSQRVIGVLRHQDLFLRPGVAPAALVIPPARLPARMRLYEAALRLREAQAPVGIVEDGGRPVGLVTLADLIEPLTGVDLAQPPAR
jgi:CBS domain containing-hemolysin-like protein